MQIRGALLRKRLVGAGYRKRWEGECQLWALEIEVTLTLKSRKVSSDCHENCQTHADQGCSTQGKASRC